MAPAHPSKDLRHAAQPASLPSSPLPQPDLVGQAAAAGAPNATWLKHAALPQPRAPRRRPAGAREEPAAGSRVSGATRLLEWPQKPHRRRRRRLAPRAAVAAPDTFTIARRKSDQERAGSDLVDARSASPAATAAASGGRVTLSSAYVYS
jgi:hypothetical protein